MKAAITRIGNSKGIIIPASMLKHCGFEKEVSIELNEQTLLITRVKLPRSGWEDAFTKAGAGDESLLMDGFDTSFDQNEWTW